MLGSLVPLLLGATTFVSAYPTVQRRNVTELDQTAFEQAQRRDNTATRAFSSIEIKVYHPLWTLFFCHPLTWRSAVLKTSSGECLFVNPLSGDARANGNPVEIGTCDGSTGQLWDIITSGVHDNVPGTMLIVNTLVSRVQLDLEMPR